MEKEQKTKDIEDNSFAQTYIERRGIDTDSSQVSRLTDIGYSEESDQVVAKLRTKDFTYSIELGSLNDTPNSEIVQFLLDCPREILSPQEGIREKAEFDAWFSDDMKWFGFDMHDKKYRVHIDKTYDIQRSPNLINKIYLYYMYRRVDSGKPGISTEVESVSGVDDLTFQLDAELLGIKDLSWEIDIPIQEDLDVHPVAKFIEKYGRGNPKNVENGTEVYVVHKSDLTGSVRPISVDQSCEWVLVSKDEYKSWRPGVYTQAQPSLEKNKKKFVILYMSYVVIFTVTFLITSGLMNAFLI